MSSGDVISIDRPGATLLWRELRRAADQLAADRRVAIDLAQQASQLTGRGLVSPERELARAAADLERQAGDLHRRLALLDDGWSELARIESLQSRITKWVGTDNDPRLDALVRARATAVAGFTGGDRELSSLMVAHLGAGRGVLDAVALARADQHERRVSAVVDATGLDRSGAVEHLARLDRQLAAVVAAGWTAELGAVALSLAHAHRLDLDRALRLGREHAADPVTVLGWMATARGIGVEVDELLALGALLAHFVAFDGARGRDDRRVSERDLEHVLTHPDDFTPVQVEAARAILDEPMLRRRLDTAAADTDIMAGPRFGGTAPGDTVISRADLEAFAVRARLAVLLAPHAELLDVAADSGAPDGFWSRADFAAAVDREDLPSEVRAAARAMVDAEWFDRTWWESHRDELAAGAAVVAGGTVIVLSGGTATPAVLATAAGAGAASAGATTVAVNLSGDAEEEVWDGVALNGFNGATIAYSLAGLPAALSAVGATSGMARLAAASGAVSEASGVVASGGFDLVLPDTVQGDVRHVAAAVSAGSGAIEWGADALPLGGASSGAAGSAAMGVDGTVDP